MRSCDLWQKLQPASQFSRLGNPGTTIRVFSRLLAVCIEMLAQPGLNGSA